jgi:sarcosine oxidase delta subunit
VHAYGCRRWFNVVRDTVTYRITAVYKAGESAPDAGS